MDIEDFRRERARIRHEMGDAFVTDVHHPQERVEAYSDMEYVEL